MSGSDTHSRRGFLGALGGFAAGMALDPDRMLWRAGAKVISIPNKPRSPFALLEWNGQKIFHCYSLEGKPTSSAMIFPADALDRRTGNLDMSRAINVDLRAGSAPRWMLAAAVGGNRDAMARLDAYCVGARTSNA